MSDRRLKPCATCGHGKTIHRVGACLHHTTQRGQTSPAIGTLVVYCQCPGYEPTTTTTQQATRKGPLTMAEPVDLMAALRGSIAAAQAQRRRDNEPCPRCGGDRLRTDFTGSGRCHAPHPTVTEGATR